MKVEEFPQSQVPEYIILSHTWREEEVTLHDLLSGVATSKKGFTKLAGCCQRAKDDGFAYCWIDTCCIDKTSSAELSEAINSMYQWYKNSIICYAYLEDVHEDPVSDCYKEFAGSKWFTRGWTLQELIAPTIVEFYDVSWSEIGTRSSLQERLTEITGINKEILTGGDPLKLPVGVRMSWAARRETSRLEDKAYCLLGIFGVNMPLLYGERERAFLRLQEEILRVNEDYTLFAWDAHSAFGNNDGLLAHSPSHFGSFEPRLNMIPEEVRNDNHFRLRENLSRTCFSLLPPPHDHPPPHLTSRGLHLTLPLRRNCESDDFFGLLALMKCSQGRTWLLCVMLSQTEVGGNRYERRKYPGPGQFRTPETLVLLHKDTLDEFQYTSIYLGVSTINFEEAALPNHLGAPSILRIALDPTLLPEVTSFTSNLMSLRSFHEENLQFRRPITTASSRGAILGELNRQSPWRSLYYIGADAEKSSPRTDSGKTVKGMISLPDLFYTRHTWNSNGMFRFMLNRGFGADLIIVVCLDRKPHLTAKLVRTAESGSKLPVSLQPDSSGTSDRAMLRFKHHMDSEDQEWCIAMSIRRTGSMPFLPSSKQYVLALTKESMVT